MDTSTDKGWVEIGTHAFNIVTIIWTVYFP